MKWLPLNILFVMAVFGINIALGQDVLPVKGLCAHRGAMDNFPENTIPSFQEAIRVGAQMIELDVNMTKDSVLVVMHDGRVDRTTNDTGFIRNYTLAEIKKLDAGSFKGQRFKDTKVPTLEEALAIMPRNIWLNCHIKGGTITAAKTTEILQKTNRLKQAFLACGIKEADAAKKVNPLVMICNMEGQRAGNTYVDNSVMREADFLQFWPKNKDSLTKEIVAKAVDNRLMINYFQSEDFRPQDIRRLFSLGIEFILVGDPERFMPYAEEFGVKPVIPAF